MPVAPGLSIVGDQYDSSNSLTITAGSELTLIFSGKTSYSNEVYQIRNLMVTEPPTNAPTASPSKSPTPTSSPAPTKFVVCGTPQVCADQSIPRGEFSKHAWHF